MPLICIFRKQFVYQGSLGYDSFQNPNKELQSFAPNVPGFSLRTRLGTTCKGRLDVTGHVVMANSVMYYILDGYIHSLYLAHAFFAPYVEFVFTQFQVRDRGSEGTFNM